MRISVIFASSIVVACCEKVDVGTGTNDTFHGQHDYKTKNVELAEQENGNPIFFAGHNRMGTKYTMMREHRASKEQGIDKNHMLKHNAYKTVGSAVFRRKLGKFFNHMVRGPRSKRQVLREEVYPNSTWKDGVFYAFNTSNHVVRKLFNGGRKIWRDTTCIDFVEDNDAPDKVVLVSEPGIFSSIGRLGGDQFISLGDGSGSATIGSAVHEIGHTLGFLHTMQRSDRDSYIRILGQNIDPHHIDEFTKAQTSDVDVYGMEYDYGSIMHYDELTPSSNNQLTMIATDSLYQKTMGSELISFSDIFMINEHYGCNQRCNKSTAAKCANEGLPHPRNCSICICPSGYGGTLCDRRPPGCGEDLVATNEKQTMTYRLGFGSDLRDHFMFCNYMITAPEGKKIEVDVRSISHGYDWGGCPRGGVEIKAQEDQKLTGYRFCSMIGSDGPVVSSSNRLPVILFNRFSTMQTIFTYRYIG